MSFLVRKSGLRTVTARIPPDGWLTPTELSRKKSLESTLERLREIFRARSVVVEQGKYGDPIARSADGKIMIFKGRKPPVGARVHILDAEERTSRIGRKYIAVFNWIEHDELFRKIQKMELQIKLITNGGYIRYLDWFANKYRYTRPPAKSWHAIIYHTDMDDYLPKSFVVHVISREKADAKELIEIAKKKRDKYGDDSMKFRYVGLEPLPVNAGEGMVVLRGVYTNDWSRTLILRAAEETGSIDWDTLIQYRRRIFTADLDPYKKDYILDYWFFRTVENLAIVALKGKVNNLAIMRSAAGFHVMGEYAEDKEFEERIKIREDCGDDDGRISHDEAMMRGDVKLEALTDTIFTEKLYVTKDGVESYVEKPSTFADFREYVVRKLEERE